MRTWGEGPKVQKFCGHHIWKLLKEGSGWRGYLAGAAADLEA